MEIGTLNQRITLLEQRVKVDAIGNHCNRRILPHHQRQTQRLARRGLELAV